MSKILTTGGVVLCGGKSSRMGESKAWLKFGSEYMLQRVTRILGQIVDPIVVVAAKEQELPELGERVIVCRDEFPEKGPLSGIFTGLKELFQLQVNAAYVTACDCPFLRPAFVQFMAAQLDDSVDMVLLSDGQYSHVLSAIYRTGMFQTAESLLKQGRLRPIGLTEHHPTCLMDMGQARIHDPNLESLVNLNSQSDYQIALARLKEQEN